MPSSAPVLQLSESGLLATVASFLWPLLRLSALFVTLPVFSGRFVPMRIRAALSVALTVVLLPLIPAPPEVAMFSMAGLLLAVQEVLIGLLAGFILQLVFSAVTIGGQAMAYSMGLGFASLVDPQTGVQVPSVAQFYLILATLIFLNMDGHLLLIQLLLDSFHSIPVGAQGLGREALWEVLAWSGRMFSAGILMALPVMVALLLINTGFGVATRVAPQLNIFSVGFVVTIFAGFLMSWVSLPRVHRVLAAMLEEGLEVIARLLQV